MSKERYQGRVEDFNSFLNYLDSMAMIISEMFGTNCEVVISDLDNPKHSVLSIYNGSVTERKVGDPLNTRAEELIQKSQDGCSINYRKANRKIKKEIKSSTIITKAFGRNISFCINYNCDELINLEHSLKRFLSMGNEVYDEFDIYDNKEIVSQKFEKEVAKCGKSIVSMNKKDRLNLIKNLRESGVFKIQKSIPYVAELMGISRYTIYNYMRELDSEKE